MATSVSPSNQTVGFIRSVVRELTASPGENQLTTAYLDQTLNNFYNSDFPYAIKLDQMRSVYTFFTVPYQDTYPLDVNYNQGVRAPVYVDGIQGQFYKDRNEFYNVWPRWPTTFHPFTGDGTTQVYNFTIPGPFLENNVTLGCNDAGGTAISIADDGKGNLWLQIPNPVTSVPSYGTNVPGMKNTNTQNPGFDNQIQIGSVNYVTGVFSINFALFNLTPASGSQATLRVSQYQTGRPYSLLFWNNYFQIRPIPKHIHKVEVETYLTPVQFMLSTDSPILNQWATYLAYGTAIEILRRRQDMAGVANLTEGFKRQEALVLERQGTEEIGQRNANIYSGSTPNMGWNSGWNQGWW